jgi:hypothetical protein
MGRYFARYAAAIFAATMSLAGCGGGSSVTPSSPAQPQAFRHAGRERSWMAPTAKKKDLLYISDGVNDDVYVYSYPGGKLEGTLTGFDSPAGECVDGSGNVFIAEFTGQSVVEYAHGGTSPIATLSDTDGYPLGCSIDPSTGNLAVTNEQTSNYGHGDLAIYKDASGTPAIYNDSYIENYDFCGYDDKGNLFLNGYTGSVTFFAELPAGSSTIKQILLNKTLIDPYGEVQWDGTYITLGSEQTASGPGLVNRIKVSGKRGKIEQTTVLTGSNFIFQEWIQGTRVIGPDAVKLDVGIWDYPSGTPIKTITGDFKEPTGSTVSLAK